MNDEAHGRSTTCNYLQFTEKLSAMSKVTMQFPILTFLFVFNFLSDKRQT